MLYDLQPLPSRLLDVVDSGEGYPPCLVFERGDRTLNDLKTGEFALRKKIEIVHEVTLVSSVASFAEYKFFRFSKLCTEFTEARSHTVT